MSCRSCDALLAPSGPRRGDQHFAIRFGDWHVRVAKDGEPVLDCYEVDCAEGTAWRYETPHRLCECGGAAAAFLDRGSFSVAFGAPASV